MQRFKRKPGILFVVALFCRVTVISGLVRIFHCRKGNYFQTEDQFEPAATMKTP